MNPVAIYSVSNSPIPVRLVPWLLAACWLLVVTSQTQASDALFAPPEQAKPTREILLVNSRPLGTACQAKLMREKLVCQRLEINEAGNSTWESVPWQHAADSTADTPTVIYVHGNRIEPGEDVFRGMKVYRSLVKAKSARQPLRFIIWSWPSTPIKGPIKDVHVKAARTRPAGWQLAWFLDQMPADANVSILGYSFGARVVSGSLHLLGGGHLGNLRLAERAHPERQPIRVGLIAPAYDADWLQPGHYHGRAVSQMERLLLVTNQRDPAMRLYHFSVERGRIHALGKEGIAEPYRMGAANRRISRIDVSDTVGRSHALGDYLAASGKMRTLWHKLHPTPTVSTATEQSSPADVRL